MKYFYSCTCCLIGLGQWAVEKDALKEEMKAMKTEFEDEKRSGESKLPGGTDDNRDAPLSSL